MRLFAITLLAALLTPCAFFAQKPVAPQAFEFGATPPASSLVLEKSRINEENGRILALYNPDVAVEGNDPETQARNYLQQHQSSFGLNQTDIDNLRLHFLRQSQAGTTVRLRQYHQGLPVNKAEITISITPQERVGFVMNSFQYGVNISNPNPSLTPAAARAIAFDYLDLRSEISEESKSLFIYATKDDSRLAYRILLAAHDPLGHWESIVDAHSGEILKVENVACYYHEHKAATEPAWHPPFVVVDGTGNVFDPDPLSTANANYNDPGYPDNNDNNSPQLLNEQRSVTLRDITFDNGQYFLSGPWAEVQDFEAPNNGLFSQASPNWNFNRSDDAFEAVNTYYHIDASMRYLNVTLGLDIRPSSYSGGVRFDPSGLSGSDNSYYSGGAQRLAFGEGGVDDAEDSDVIHHELGHGLHDWVTGGGLSQQQGLSEGCGDYWAASYNRSLGHWTSNDPAYHWVFRWDGHNAFWNGRITNLSGTYPSALTGGIHNQGQFWATSMMKVWDAVGKTKTDIIFWEGLGMTNGSSNQNDAANAVYQAATNLGCTNEERLQIHSILTDQGYVLPTFALPVSWTSVEANKEAGDVRIKWTTAAEINNSYFTVERSIDGGKTFTSLGRIAAATNTPANSYGFLDTAPAIGTNIYRIKQTDVDGTFSYSPIRTVSFSQKEQYQLAPNPVKDLLFVELPLQNQATNIKVSIIDLSGKQWLSKRMDNDGNARLQLSTTQLPTGIYLLQLETNGNTVTRRFVKQ